MNAVEIEEAVSALAEAPFDPAEFPYAFLAAFGNKETTLKRLRATGKGSTNKSDVPGGVLQRNNIHLAVAEPGAVGQTLDALRQSPATAKQKAKFALATDGQTIEAENLNSGETLVCEYRELGDHFGFFLELAGITTVRQIRENAFDIKATGRLNRLYVELFKHNPDWDAAEHRETLNHFFARLIFCFFAEDTGIFHGEGRFTQTLQQMTEPDGSNTAWVLSEIFRAMDVPIAQRGEANLRPWADAFPYVNGGLFSGAGEGDQVPRFTKIARSYLLHIGTLDWTKINPDIFGSMIQAVADDEERGALGMHYTSVPNILKVLNPLFLDDLRSKLEEAGGSPIKLLNLRKRLARIRVFDPACGSGNFLVIAYKQMREIEAEINRRRGEADRRSDIPLTNFRGIELRHFAAEVARLALIIAEYQCDVLCRGPRLALAEFLPLSAENWITHGNALRVDWLRICPPTGTASRLHADDLYSTPLDQAEMDFENEGGETYICGNPPYVGTKYQSADAKSDLAFIFEGASVKVGNADYVLGWIRKASPIVSAQQANAFAFVTTNSLFQGEQAELILWLLDVYKLDIEYAHTSFKWSNNAAKNAGVICCISKVVAQDRCGPKIITDEKNSHEVSNIGPYLVEMPRFVVRKQRQPISGLRAMGYGSMANDAGNLLLSRDRFFEALARNPRNTHLLRKAVGGADFIRGITRYTIYVPPSYELDKDQSAYFSDLFEKVRVVRSSSARAATVRLAKVPHQYAEPRHSDGIRVFIPQTLSGRREYITSTILSAFEMVIAPHMQIPDGGPLEFALISSRLHWVWINTVCGKLKTDIRYSNTLGWNTFPVPSLSEANKAELTRRAEDILLAREAHWPATIADLYDPERMPDDLRAAHDRNDETLERIYIGRRFRNDTERLETLFEMYTEMTAKKAGKGQK